MSDMRNSTAKTEAAPFAARAVYSDVYPLDEFYNERGETLPVIGRVEPDEIPEPYKSLLVHDGDMTSRLESFHGEQIHIQLLARHTHENEYFREVVLTLNGIKKPVEFGAIKIILDLFPVEAQREILKEHRPLGAILKQFKIKHSSQPKVFLTIASDKFINRVLKLESVHSLYGRRNTLVDAWDRPLAEIVEILPP
jgi:chorismate-pyruvate lyase